MFTSSDVPDQRTRSNLRLLLPLMCVVPFPSLLSSFHDLCSYRTVESSFHWGGALKLMEIHAHALSDLGEPWLGSAVAPCKDSFFSRNYFPYVSIPNGGISTLIGHVAWRFR